MVSPEGPDDIEVSLEPNASPVGKTYPDELFAQAFRPPLSTWTMLPIAVCADTCGNLIQLYAPANV